MKKVLVLGGGGFIGSHLVTRLKEEGCWVRSVDLKRPRFSASDADEFVVGDLRDPLVVRSVIDVPFDEIYQLAADMGGAGFVFVGVNDADIMHNSALINLNVLKVMDEVGCQQIFYSSSACIYPEYNQLDPDDPKCSEDTAYPAAPDSEYGWEKLFSERLYFAFGRNKNMKVRVARYHNIFGPQGSWDDGREKAPAAMCRKASDVALGITDTIEVWGPGVQTRSFLFVSDCIDATLAHARGDYEGVINIGSEEMVTINLLAQMAAELAGVECKISNIDGPIGVMGRNSDNALVEREYGWNPSVSLIDGMRQTYQWIHEQNAEAK